MRRRLSTIVFPSLLALAASSACSPGGDNGGRLDLRGTLGSSPVPGTIFMYLERIPLEDGGFFADDGRSYRTASYFMLDCGSGITPERLAEYEGDPAVGLIGMLNFNYLAGCSEWDGDLGDEFRQNFETDIPTVIVHGTWDTSTPFENALELVPFFKNSKFIPVIRGPHGAIVAARQASEEFDEGILKSAAAGDRSELPDQVELPPPLWVVPGGN